VLVDVTMFRPRGEPLPLDYRVREVDGAPKVLDVIIGGVSFALLKREEFRAILERGGPEALIAHLQAGAL
jgi:ABC-type transport system involved in resistance to organic solvents, auxiliary component